MTPTNARTILHAHDAIWKSWIRIRIHNMWGRALRQRKIIWTGWLWWPRWRPTLSIDHRHDDNRLWKVRIHIDILEFHSSLQPKDFLNWITNVDDILDFKEVLEDRRVQLVHGGVSLHGGNKINFNVRGWARQKLLFGSSYKNIYMQAAFLPHNYIHLMYQKLQDLR